MLNFIKTNLRGMGQIMLQNSAWTGALFLIGILYNSREMFWGAVMGMVCATAAAIYAKYKKSDIDAGLYGFNGVLVGIALVFFYGLNFEISIAIAIFSALSTYIMHFMHEKNLSPYTFPFVLSAWASIFLINYFNIVELREISQVAYVNMQSLNIFTGISMGLGQVMFQASIMSGIIFFLGLLIHSRRSAFWGLSGSVLGLFIAYLSTVGVEPMNIGLFGFNAVLCAIAFSNEKKYRYLYVVIAVFLSVLIMQVFDSNNLIALTAPFVFATWITMFIRHKIIKN